MLLEGPLPGMVMFPLHYTSLTNIYSLFHTNEIKYIVCIGGKKDL